MHKLRLIICAPFLLLLASFLACNDEDNYSSSSQDLLSFSADTVRFDTILSTINTPFNAFMVYNRNSKPLLISSIRLKNAGESGFKINVDGAAGSSFENVEIRAKDSLFVFVNIKPDVAMNSQPVLITDYIEFITNNVKQEIVLEAYNQDVVVWDGQILISDSILDNQIPYLVFDSLVIEEGVLVEIKEGTTFYMHNNAEIVVKGTLNINGTPENPVTIRGDRMDKVVGISYDLVPGQWGGIRFTSTSFNNVFENVHIRNGNYGLKLEASEPIESKIRMKNVVLTNAKGILINSVNCKLIAENCEFSNSRGALLNLIGGHYSFTHCTMANYYFSSTESGWGNSNNETVILSNSYFNEKTKEFEYYPVEQAAFYNSIIWGSKYKTSSEVSIQSKPESSMSYYFQNCLIPNANAVNDDVNNTDTIPTIVNCLFNTDPRFRDTDTGNGNDDFIYDFRIDSLSPARNLADPNVSRLIPLDMNGLDRFSDEGPDMGGYEYYKEEEEEKNE